MADDRLHELEDFDYKAEFEVRQQVQLFKRLLLELARRSARSDTTLVHAANEMLVTREHVVQAARVLLNTDISSVSSSESAKCVFLSHATTEMEYARDLQEDLQREGLTCFLAELSIKPGSRWPDELWQSIRTCKVFLLLATEQAVKSKWCLPEVGAALALQKTVIAALPHSTKLPQVLHGFQHVPLQTKQHRKDLIRHLKQLCSS